MNKFNTALESANNAFRLLNQYGNRGFTFNDYDTENIYLFVSALKSIKDVEDIEVSEINSYNLVVVNFTAKTNIADAICSSIIDAFRY